jgi:hypothetical protein
MPPVYHGTWMRSVGTVRPHEGTHTEKLTRRHRWWTWASGQPAYFEARTGENRRPGKSAGLPREIRFEVVQVVRTIKWEMLWRADYASSGSCVEHKWRMSRQYSNPLLDDGEIIEQVKSVTQGDTGPAGQRGAYRQLKSLLDQNVEPALVGTCSNEPS